MELAVFLKTFIAVFLAEMGDKTQLAVVGFSSEGSSKLTVFIASSLALIAVTGIGVLAGGLVAKYVNPIYIKYGSGGLFIIIGLLIIFKK